MVAIVFMIAGMSSRFGGKAKQLEKVGPSNETLIEFSVNQALKNNFSQLVFITNPTNEDKFIQIFGYKYQNRPVKYLKQTYDETKRIRPWGTTDAICVLHQKIFEPFIIVNGDDIYGEEAFKTGFNLIINKKINIIGTIKLLKTLPENGTVNRGVIQVDNGTVNKIEEIMNITKQANQELYDSLANINFIGLQPDVLELLFNILCKFKNEHQTDKKIECLLPNNLSQLIHEKLITMEYFLIENDILGITNPGDELILKQKLKELSI